MSKLQALQWAKQWRGYTGTVGFLSEGIIALASENAKFKEALEQIAHDKPVHDGFTSMAANEIAKNALVDK